MITGASGLLGHALCEHFSPKYQVTGLRLSNPIGVPGVSEISANLREPSELEQIFKRVRPELVIHTAGLTNVDLCESDPALAKMLNVEMTRLISENSKRAKAKLIHISTDHLFDGRSSYSTEESEIHPLNNYARTKAEAEKIVGEDPGALIIRTNFYGKGRPWRSSFSDWVLGSLRENKAIHLFHDIFVSPIHLSHLSQLIEELVSRDARGILNVASAERVSKHDFGIKLARKFGYETSLIVRTDSGSVQLRAPRPKDMSLSCEKLTRLLGRPAPTVDEGIESLFKATPRDESAQVVQPHRI